MVKKIDDVYTGDIAAGYDAKRQHSTRWNREEQVIIPVLKTIAPDSHVVDIAAGTGRWLHVYKELGVDVTLSDASADMLEVARAKAAGLDMDVAITQQSAMSDEPFPKGDVAVITNFLNWISLEDARIVLRKLVETGAERFLFMIAYLPGEWSGPKRSLAKARIGWKNTRSKLGLREKGYYHLHDEPDLRVLFRQIGMEIVRETVINERSAKRVTFIEARPAAQSQVQVVNEMAMVSGDSAEVDGKLYSVNAGAWTIYVPDLRLKVLRADNGKCACRHDSAPSLEDLQDASPEKIRGRYTNAEWRDSLSKSVFRRAAENWVAAKRLADHGLGPAVQAAVVVRSFRDLDQDAKGPSAGILVENLLSYPKRRNVTDTDMLTAHVQPDRIRSSIRQQIRGYVSDLNSVVGVVPINAESAVAGLENRLISVARV